MTRRARRRMAVSPRRKTGRPAQCSAAEKAKAPDGRPRGFPGGNDQGRLMVNLPTETPRLTPSPVPASASETVALVSTCACELFTTPASAPAFAQSPKTSAMPDTLLVLLLPLLMRYLPAVGDRQTTVDLPVPSP